MECSGFCSPRSDAFPVGLRVLVVDDDPTWLKILEKMLKKCSYEVTTCGLAREALDLLRERKEGFDIVISDVNMPDMDGFKLLERVGLELDLPVIMMSVDGETSRVMKGVQHGACDYLLKPIRMKELKNIWQHVLRKRIHDVKETDSDGLEEIQMMNGSLSEYANDYYSFSMGDMCSGKKRRKDSESKYEDRDYSETSSIKKPRVVWTVDLHQKFVKAVNQIGLDRGGPKKILDLMGVPWLTRENVASHLQKYRLYLSRLPKDGELEDTSFTDLRGADVPPRDPAETVFLQSPTNAQQNDVRNGNCGTSGNKSPEQNIDVKIHDEGIKEFDLGLVAEQSKVLREDDFDSKKSSNECLTSGYSFLLPCPDVTPTESVPSQYLWTAAYPQTQCKQESKSHQHLGNKFSYLSQKIQQNEQVNSTSSSSYFSLRPASRKEDNLADLEVQGIRVVPEAEIELDLFTIQSDSQLTSSQQFGRTPSPTWSIKNFSSSADHVLLEDQFVQRDIGGLSSGSALSFGDRESLANVLQTVHQPINVGIHDGESFGCIDQELLAAVTLTPLYESLKFDYEYSFDSMEYPVLDSSLFIV